MTAVAGRGRPRPAAHRVAPPLGVLLPPPPGQGRAALSLPVAWFVVFYLGSLTALLWQSYHKLDDFTAGQVDTSSLTPTPGRTCSPPPTATSCCARWAWRPPVTVGVVIVVAPSARLLHGPRGPAPRPCCSSLVLLLWPSYLARAYSWKLILAKEGVLPWFLDLFGLRGGARPHPRAARHRWVRASAVSSLPASGCFLYTGCPTWCCRSRRPRAGAELPFVEASGDLGIPGSRSDGSPGPRPSPASSPLDLHVLAGPSATTSSHHHRELEPVDQRLTSTSRKGPRATYPRPAASPWSLIPIMASTRSWPRRFGALWGTVRRWPC